jgi:micrococcal nuclease
MIFMKKCLVYCLFVTVLMVALGGCSQPASDNGRIPVKIVKVIDGDTIKVDVDGKEETVRFLLVDTPETVHPTKPVQPFGKEASQFTKDLLNSSDVELELGVGERDKYGRLLAYVYADGKSVQELLLEKGLARVAYVFEPNTKYIDEYREIQTKAQKQAIGIWSLEDYASEDGFDSDKTANNVPSSENTEASVPNGKCTIKGNINSSGDKIYHVESGRYYKITKPEKWFCTEKEAVDAGFRKSEQ